MRDYQQTITVMKFVDGTSKKWYEDKYQVRKEEEAGVVRVYSNATGNMVFEGFLRNLCYIQYNVPKRTTPRHITNAKTSTTDYGSAVTVGDEVDMDDIQAEFANNTNYDESVE